MAELSASSASGRRFVVLITDGTPTFSLGCEGTGFVTDPVDPSPLVSEAGAPSGVICLFTDLTAVVDLEEEDVIVVDGDTYGDAVESRRQSFATSRSPFVVNFCEHDDRVTVGEHECRARRHSSHCLQVGSQERDVPVEAAQRFLRMRRSERTDCRTEAFIASVEPDPRCIGQSRSDVIAERLRTTDPRGGARRCAVGP